MQSDLGDIPSSSPPRGQAGHHNPRAALTENSGVEPAASTAQQVMRVTLAVALVALGLWTLWNYLPALVWAGIFAIALWPLYQRAQTRWPPGRHNILVPAVFTSAVALLFVVPLALVAIQLGHEAHSVLSWVREVRATGIPVPNWLSRLPLAGPLAVEWWRANLADPQGAAELLGRPDRGDMVTFSRHLGVVLLHRAVLLGFMLLALFFLFRNGLHVTAQMLIASHRAFGPRGERVGRQIIASVRGTVDGLVLVGLGEGVLLGIAYVIAGVPHPALLGSLTAIAAMIPFGAPLMFGAASLLLLAQGATIAAAAVLAFGFAVVFVADHAIRPVLIGGATRLPFLWVLLGILGGVETWGLLGLFLGPAIMAVLILLWREWTEGSDSR
jgi:predicted PurR-regulated permease PerM